MINNIISRYQLNSSVLLISLLAFIFIFADLVYSQSPVGKIIVQVNGFENNNGKARFLIFSSKDKSAFPKEKENAYGKFIVPIKYKKVTFTFENLPYGDYAISVHHDEDNNGKVNSNLLGIPNEGLGSSNDAKGFMGPPSFDKAKITLNKEQLSIIINIVN